MSTGGARDGRGWSERPTGSPSLDTHFQDEEVPEDDPRERTQPGIGEPATLPVQMPQQENPVLNAALLYQSERLRLVEQQQTHERLDQIEARVEKYATDTKDDIFGLREMLARMDRLKDEQHKAERREDKEDLDSKLAELRTDMKSRTFGRPLIWVVVLFVAIGAAGAATAGWSLLEMQRESHLRGER